MSKRFDFFSPEEVLTLNHQFLSSDIDHNDDLFISMVTLSEVHRYLNSLYRELSVILIMLYLKYNLDIYNLGQYGINLNLRFI